MGTESNREKYKNFKINNKNLYERYKEEPISLTMKVNKWKVLGHATCYFPKIHLQEKLWLTIFKILESTKKYQGKVRKTVAVSIHEIKEMYCRMMQLYLLNNSRQ